MPNRWIEPVTDRVPLSTNEASDLERIELDTLILSEVLNVPIAVGPSTWEGKPYIPKSEMDRLVNNVRVIETAYHKPTGTPPLPDPPYFVYWKLNDLEENLRRVFEMWEANHYEKIYAGEIYASEKIGVI